MATEGQNGSGGSTWKKLGISSAVAAVGAGIGLLLTAKPKRLRETVSELPGGARNLAEDLIHRGPGEDDVDDSSRPIPEEISDQFKARRRERRERRERRQQHATR
jgi:hypothetical protein